MIGSLVSVVIILWLSLSPFNIAPLLLDFSMSFSTNFSLSLSLSLSLSGKSLLMPGEGEKVALCRLSLFFYIFFLYFVFFFLLGDSVTYITYIFIVGRLWGKWRQLLYVCRSLSLSHILTLNHREGVFRVFCAFWSCLARAESESERAPSEVQR